MPPAEPAPDCWLHADTEIRPSLIAGRGLFATAPISTGAPVSRVGGRLVDATELKALFADPEHYVDSIVVDDDLHLVLPVGSSAHWVNHSCEPNLGWRDEYTLVALRDIAVDEELTDDYATSTVDPEFVMYCRCETYRCRQVIEGTDWRIPQLQKRYAGQWVPYIRRRIASEQDQ